MRTATLTLLTLAALGCKSPTPEDEPEPNPLLEAADTIEGIYTLADLNENLDDCDGEGQDILALIGTTHAFVRGTSFFGLTFLEVVGCDGVADCRELSESDIVITNYTFQMDQYDGSTFVGDGVFTGFGVDGLCEDPEATHTEFTETAGRFELTYETAIGDDYPVDADGFCSTEAAEPAVAGAACSTVLTMRGDFLEAL